ncbi:hypothetical protein KIS1582_0376 [Cytobacillus firmus]|uniref:Uncharacterized protein n=1 Tax=Cytobacillus firmus TaxID=1399 RepID=A0A800NFJ8_CYTFI|nr:hypothetical protein KIS1582_0376 [Cytobacillus firmus]
MNFLCIPELQRMDAPVLKNAGVAIIALLPAPFSSLCY